MAVASPSPRSLWLKAAKRSEATRAIVAQRHQRLALAAATPRLARQVSRAFLRLSASAVHGPAVKQAVNYPLTYRQPDWNAFAREMEQILIKETVNLGEMAFANVRTQLDLTLTFDLNERIIPKGVIARRVTNVTDTTRRAINATIRQGIDDGVHPSVIAKRMRDQIEGWAGLENLKKSRAYTIARTETANAYNLGAIAGYRATGIVRQLRTIDAPTCGWTSHNDPDSASGKIVTLDQAARQPISHPNCVRAFAPIAAGLEQPIEDTGDPYANPQNFLNDGAYSHGGAPLEMWADQIIQAVFPQVTTDMRQAMANYSGSGYRWMNQHLRGELDAGAIGLQKIIELDSFLNLGRTPDAIVVRRGVGSGRKFGFTGSGNLEHAQTLIGSAWTEEGFMSTALSADAAFGGVQLELTVPKGHHAMPVSSLATGGANEPGSPYSTSMFEAELLLQRDTRYVIESVSRASNGDVILRGRVLLPEE